MQGLTWSFVELTSHFVQIGLRVHGALWEEAKGDLATIHQNLLSDGLAFHTLVPHEGGATVYAAATEAKDVPALVAATEKAAGRYGSKVTNRHGRGEFIGDNSDNPTRDRARSIYEANIRQSDVHSGQAVWQSIRDRWSKTLCKALSESGPMLLMRRSGEATSESGFPR